MPYLKKLCGITWSQLGSALKKYRRFCTNLLVVFKKAILDMCFRTPIKGSRPSCTSVADLLAAFLHMVGCGVSRQNPTNGLNHYCEAYQWPRPSRAKNRLDSLKQNPNNHQQRGNFQFLFHSFILRISRTASAYGHHITL